MSDTVIRVEHISKKYSLGGHTGSAYYITLREKIIEIGKNLVGRTQTRLENSIWALDDVSFEVQRGEALAVIGKNGAGKSTLLKILSRITRPTKGLIEIRGRVGSLLEVGTGFHPELTGRENIYLNGAILNMRRHEIQRKFDEIVSFAGVEKFMDTPVKRYSSGMYLRLAFAVAAHMEPEILVVDEVLAVGDLEFQKKCLGKMGNVAREGRTVIFVSHNMAAVNQLCQTAIVLDAGRASGKMSVQEGILAYTEKRTATELEEPVTKGDVTIHHFLVEQMGLPLEEYDNARAIDIRIKFSIDRDMTDFRVGFFLKTWTGDTLARSLLADWNKDYTTLRRGNYELRGSIPPFLLNKGSYLLQPHVSIFDIRDYNFEASISKEIQIRCSSEFNPGYPAERAFGPLLLNSNWELTQC